VWAWQENVYWHISGEEIFQWHRWCDSSDVVYFGRRIDGARVKIVFKAGVLLKGMEEDAGNTMKQQRATFEYSFVR